MTLKKEKKKGKEKKRKTRDERKSGFVLNVSSFPAKRQPSSDSRHFVIPLNECQLEENRAICRYINSAVAVWNIPFKVTVLIARKSQYITPCSDVPVSLTINYLKKKTFF